MADSELGDAVGKSSSDLSLEKKEHDNLNNSRDSLEDPGADRGSLTDDSSGAPSAPTTEDSESPSTGDVSKEPESDEADRSSPSPPRICDPTSRWSRDRAMYAPKTVGFPPSRASLIHTIPTGATFVSPPRLGGLPIGGNPFAMVRATVPTKGPIDTPEPFVRLTPSRLGASTSSGSTEATSISSKPVLRPSSLISGAKFGPSDGRGDGQPEKSGTFQFQPSRLGNPFDKTESGDEKMETKAEEEIESELVPKPGGSNEHGNSTIDDDGAKTGSAIFVPLAPTAHVLKDDNFAPHGQQSSVPGFVFGQNLRERVTVTDAAPPTHAVRDMTLRDVSGLPGTSPQNMTTTSKGSGATTNGTPENLFSAALKNDKSDGEESNDWASKSTSPKTKSLSEAAREYEESRAVKRKFEEVQVITGEEDESNVLQLNCKLFAFDKVKSSWTERGRGQLRLNDKDLGDGTMQSRLIMRTQGSLRLILNTKVWTGMSVDRPSDKSIRFTASDSEQIKVFLIMASVKDTEQLFNALEWRVATLRSQEENKSVERLCPAATFSRSSSASSSSRRSPPQNSPPMHFQMSVPVRKEEALDDSPPKKLRQEDGGEDGGGGGGEEKGGGEGTSQQVSWPKAMFVREGF